MRAVPADALETPASRLPRLPRLDALRGVAIVWMAVFHFCFDLVYFGFSRQNFYADPFWTVQRTCIVSVFLLCAGAGQAVATAGPSSTSRFDARFLRRWAQIAGCAAAVSVGSWLMFPRSFISFGVLHCMAVSLLLIRATRPSGHGLWLAAALCLLLPVLVASPWFDGRWTNWIGLVTVKPIAEDYVPLLPWFGMICTGLAVGQWLLKRRPGWLAGPLPSGLRPLATLGRWSLAFYMLHQPVLIGLLAALAWNRRA